MRPFEVMVIPADTAFEISAKLLSAQDKGAVKSVFDGAREALETDSAMQIDV